MEVSPRLQAFVEYFAMTEPNTINKIAYKHGYIPPQSLETRVGFLYELLFDNEDLAMQEMMANHPDRDMVLAVNKPDLKKEDAVIEKIAFDGIKPNTIISKQDNVAIVLIGLLILWYLIVNK